MTVTARTRKTWEIVDCAKQRALQYLNCGILNVTSVTVVRSYDATDYSYLRVIVNMKAITISPFPAQWRRDEDAQ